MTQALEEHSAYGVVQRSTICLLISSGVVQRSTICLLILSGVVQRSTICLLISSGVVQRHTMHTYFFWCSSQEHYHVSVQLY